MEKKIRYVDEVANKRYPELEIGVCLVQVDDADVYRVLSPGERFFKAVDGNSDQLFGISPFDLCIENPLSQEVRGPWIHTRDVVVDFDTLPGDKVVSVTQPRYNDNKTRVYTAVCIDPMKYQGSVEELEEFVLGLSAQFADNTKHILGPGEWKIDYRNDLEEIRQSIHR